jgi:plasmid stabilization system protein ParE
MKLHLVSAARDEAREAALHYLNESPRVAAAFVDEVAVALSRIQEDPAIWRPVDGEVRRYLLRRFPFGVYYTIERDGIVVWAIMHLRRRPGYWRERRSWG